MQKKLKLTVMALCLASAVFAQNTKTATTAESEEQSILSEQAFTFTEAQLGEDEDMAQNVSVISSNTNVFANSAGFLFSPGRFRYRAFNQKYNEIYINGVPMNDLESGQFRFANISGLNRQTNSSRETALPFEFNNFSMSSMAGSNNYDFRPSHMATGHYAAVSGANRSYQLRGVYTYNTGLRPDGWAFSAGLTYRWAHQGYIEGTFYNSLSYFFGAEKKINDEHSFSIVTWGTPTERASQGAATDESYYLANSNYYNPYWGYQDGKKRNSRVVNDFSPTLVMTWDWAINQKTKLATSLQGRYSIYKGTKLNYNGGENPAPDYWKRLPSASYDVWYADDIANTTEAYADFYAARTYMMGNKEARQIDWDALYYANRQGNATGRDAAYYIEAKHINTLNLTLASILKTELTKNLGLSLGVQLATNKGMHFKTMDDMLGANTYHNINSFALGKYAPDAKQIQYDLYNPNPSIKVGDIIDYNYNLFVNKAQAWAALKYTKGRLHAFAAGRVSGITIQREGKMLNGIAEANHLSSYGNSGKAKFADGGGKAGITYNIGGGHTISLGAGYELKAPQPQTTFAAPEVHNEFAANLKNEKILSTEAGYQFQNAWLKFNLNGYYSRLKDLTEFQNFFDDNINSFSYVSMTNIKKEYYGLEWGLNIKVSPSFSIKTLGYCSEAINTNNATVRYMNSTEGITYEEMVLNKNMRESGTPLSAYSLVLSYHAKGWFIDVNGNYYDRIYLGYSPSYRYESSLRYREKNAIARGIAEERVFDDNGDLIQSAVAQAKGKGGFMLDLSIGRSIRMKKGMLSINFSLTNVLNNTNLVTGGYEQSRSNYSVRDDNTISTSRKYRFDKNPKKYYAYGINGMLNIGYKF